MNDEPPQSTVASGTGSRDERCIAELITSREAVGASVPVLQVAERFRREIGLEALGVVDAQGAPIGLLDRTKLLLKLSQQYGYALYSRAPIEALLEGQPHVVHAQLRLGEVLALVMERDESVLYDALVVVDDDRNFLGLVPFRQLVLQQSHALANATLERQRLGHHAREIERVADLKSKFLAHVTHELRAPVNAMLGVVDLLAYTARDGDVRRTDELLALLASSATSLRTIITNVLDLSKIEAGKMELLVEDFDLNAIVRDVASMTRVLLGRKAVTVEVVAHDGPSPLRSDPVKVKQVLTNLASNAAKFTAKGQVRFEVVVEPASVAVTVRDTGVGIPQEKLAEIFEPFTQVGNVHTRQHDGTGLGLNITAHLLRLLGGSVRVESQPNAGSAFRVRFPQLRDETSA